MPINATCQACSKSFVVPDSAAGKRFKCRSCGQPMEVPVGAGAAGAKMDQPMAPSDAPAKFNESPSEAFKVNPDPANDTALELKMGASPSTERLDVGKSTIYRALKIERERLDDASRRRSALEDKLDRLQKLVTGLFVALVVALIALAISLLV